MNWVFILLIVLLVLILIVSIFSFILKSVKFFVFGSAVVVSGVVIIWAFLRLLGYNVLG